LILISPAIHAGLGLRAGSRIFSPGVPGIVLLARRGSIDVFVAMIIEFLIAILRVILWVIFVELVYLVGGLVLRVVSFGSVRAAPSCIPYQEFNWFCYRRSGNGWIEVESTVAGAIGLFICFIGLAVSLHFF
jgi:hypothetical protein